MNKDYIETKVFRNKDKTCREDNCTNQEYRVDWLTPSIGMMVCIKHYKEFVEGCGKQ